ncbi:hypothetical protein RNZ50_13055 [Paracoccaceae bacterium Fryx2]|nr:hypothetical protein [Paracoccaceae bacterium Fryx2]
MTDHRSTPRATAALVADALAQTQRSRDLLALATASTANALTALEAILHGGFIPTPDPVSPTAEHRAFTDAESHPGSPPTRRLKPSSARGLIG